MEKDTGPWADYQPTDTAGDTKPWEGYKPTKEPTRSRSLLEASNDLVIEGANAAAGGVSSLANFIKPGNRVSSFIDENIIKMGEAKQSDIARGAKQSLSSGIQNADGMLGELGAVGKYVVQNPGLATAQALGSFALPGGAVKGTGKLAQAFGAGAKGVETAGRAGGIAAGAAMSGGDAAGSAYELSKNAGATEDQAIAAGRQASVIPAIVGGVSGAYGAEKLLAGGKGFQGGLISRALKTGASEAGQEALDEGVSTYEGQRAAMPYDQTIDPMKGVAGAAALGAAMGGVTGAGVSLVSGEGRETAPIQDPVQEPSQDPTQDPPQTPSSPVEDVAGTPTMGQPLTDTGVGMLGAATDPLRSVVKPSKAMGIDPSAGALSKVAAMAVDSGVTEQVQAEQMASQVQDAVIKGEKTEPQAQPQAEQVDPFTNVAPTPPPAQAEPVPMESRGLDELRQALRNAQDPAIRKTVAAEIRKRRESMPDPLQQTQGVQASVTEADQTEQASAKQQKAEQPAKGLSNVTRTNDSAAPVKERSSVRGNDAPIGKTTASSDSVVAGKNGGTAAESQAVDRSDNWRGNAIKAGKVARSLGLDPKGKRLAQIVAEIDAKESNGPATDGVRTAAKASTGAGSDNAIASVASPVDGGSSTGRGNDANNVQPDARDSAGSRDAVAPNDAGSLNVKNTPSQSAGAKTQAAPAQTPTAGRGDAGPVAGVPAAGGSGNAQADGVKDGSAISEKSEQPTPVEQKPKDEDKTLSKEDRQKAIDAETMENRKPTQVAQPTPMKRVSFETQTLSGPKKVNAKLYELPGYDGPQIAVVEYKTSRGIGYKVYLPKSGAFITDNNGVSNLKDTLELAVLRIKNAREAIGKRNVQNTPQGTAGKAALVEAAAPKGGDADRGQVDGEQGQAREGTGESLTDRPNSTRTLELRRIAEKEVGNYARLDGKTIEQKIPVEGMTEPAVLKMDAAKALRDLDAREATLEALKKCLGRKS